MAASIDEKLANGGANNVPPVILTDDDIPELPDVIRICLFGISNVAVPCEPRSLLISVIKSEKVVAVLPNTVIIRVVPSITTVAVYVVDDTKFVRFAPDVKVEKVTGCFPAEIPELNIGCSVVKPNVRTAVNILISQYNQ